MKALESTKDADFGREVIPHSLNKFRAYGYLFDGYWKDVGTIESYYEASIELATGRPYFSFFYEGLVFTRPRFLPSARIARSRIEKSLIAEGAVIGDAEIKDSIIGLRSVIGRGSSVKRSIMMGGDYYEDAERAQPVTVGIGNNCEIERVIVDKNARIGNNVTIKNLKKQANFDGENYFIRDGIVIVPKNTVIKDGTRI
jgi:glucose-1-phosphate adenylyltransferase